MNVAPPVRPADRAALELLHRLSLTESGPVPFAAWRDTALSGAANYDSAKRAFNRAVSALDAAGFIQREGEMIRPSQPQPLAAVRPCPVAHLPRADREQAIRLLNEHERLATRLERTGLPSDSFAHSSRFDVASRLFATRLYLSRAGVAVPPLSEPAKCHFVAVELPQ
jgi:hypothetical protein